MRLTIEEQYRKTVLFDDDQINIASDQHQADYIFRILEEEYESWGLTINIANYLKVDTREDNPD